MNVSDLIDTTFVFNCDFAGDACEYWDYDFSAKYENEYVYLKNLNVTEIETLRENCKKILNATDYFE